MSVSYYPHRLHTTTTIIFRLYIARTHQEVYRFSDVPKNIAIDIKNKALANDLGKQPGGVDYAMVVIGIHPVVIRMDIAKQMITELQREHRLHYTYEVEYQNFTREFHNGSSFQHHKQFDGTNDAWVTQMNTGSPYKSFKQNQADAAVHFTGRPQIHENMF